jgi:hypothetical protein
MKIISLLLNIIAIPLAVVFGIFFLAAPLLYGSFIINYDISTGLMLLGVTLMPFLMLFAMYFGWKSFIAKEYRQGIFAYKWVLVNLVLMFACFGVVSYYNQHQQMTDILTQSVESVDTTPSQEVKIVEKPTLLFSSKMDDMDIPRTVVSYAHGNTVEKIDTSVMGEFRILEANEKVELKLPKSYIVVGSAFWAGLQVTIAIDSTANGYVIKRQYQDEGGDGNEPFEVVKTFPN